MFTILYVEHQTYSADSVIKLKMVRTSVPGSIGGVVTEQSEFKSYVFRKLSSSEHVVITIVSWQADWIFKFLEAARYSFSIC